MVKVPNKLVVFGVVAAAALAVPGVLGPLMFDQAYAARDNTNKCNNNAQGVTIGVCANVSVEDIPVCAQVNAIASDNLNQCQQED